MRPEEGQWYGLSTCTFSRGNSSSSSSSNTNVNVDGAVIMTIAIARDHVVNLIPADSTQDGCQLSHQAN